MMGRPKKEVMAEVPANDTELENILKDLRNNELQAIMLVKHLEGDAYKEDEHTVEFCKSYAVKVIQTYCKDTTASEVKSSGGRIVGKAKDKVELMLAVCGLLKDFEFKPNCLGDRMHDYYDYAHGYNDLIKGVWKGSSIDTMIRNRLDAITWELTNTLDDLKNKHGQKLGFLNTVPKELELPHPRDRSGLETSDPDSVPSAPSGQESDGALGMDNPKLDDVSRGTSERNRLPFAVLVLLVIANVMLGILAVSAIKSAFSSSPTSSNYPAKDGGNILVEKLTCNPTPVKVYPGGSTTLPIKVIPNEATGTFLYCTSLNEDILYGLDGTEAKVEVLDNYSLGDPPAMATVMIVPQNRAASNVYIEVPVIVDYTNTLPEPRN